MTTEGGPRDPSEQRLGPVVRRLPPDLAKQVEPAIERLPAELAQRSQDLIAEADARSYGVAGVVLAAARGFTAARATTGAAAVTYYALLSLFPLLMMIVSLASVIFGRDRVVEQLSATLAAFIPVGQDILQQALDHASSSPGSFQLVALGVLLWGATGFLAELQAHINRAWEPLGGRASTLRGRGLAALVVLILLLALILLITVNYVLAPAAAQISDMPLLNAVARSILTPLVQWLMLWLLTGCLVFVAYLQAPGVRVWPRAAFYAALVVSAAWQLAALGFGWWVDSGWANYEQLYGSLSAGIALLVWMYVSALIILAGAHLAAAMQQCWGPRQTDSAAAGPAEPRQAGVAGRLQD